MFILATLKIKLPSKEINSAVVLTIQNALEWKYTKKRKGKEKKKKKRIHQYQRSLVVCVVSLVTDQCISCPQQFSLLEGSTREGQSEGCQTESGRAGS